MASPVKQACDRYVNVMSNYSNYIKNVANTMLKSDIIKATTILSHDDQNEHVGVAVEVDAAIVAEDGFDLARALFSFP